MKVRSAKQKGRKGQKEIVELLMKTFPDLTDDDIKSTPSSVVGEDIIFSKKAKKKLGISIEVKYTERLNLWSSIKQAIENCDGRHPVVFFRKNNQQWRVIINADYYLDLLKKARK